MLVTAGKYTDVRRVARKASAAHAVSAPAHGPQVLIRKHKQGQAWDIKEWADRELREGRHLWKYLMREKHQTEARLRALARTAQFQKPNPKSDLKLLATIPARDYFRWLRVDPNFWMDDANLKSLRRDNDTMRALIHV